MAILVDPPRWPAHGTRFAHLACDVSLEELHAFARAQGIAERAFDHDHYDVAADQVPQLVAAGAQPVESRELVDRIRAAGLRVRPKDRLPRRARAEADLTRSWASTLPDHPLLGQRLLARWQEPQRRYHDTRHLLQMMDALTLLYGSTPPLPARLAAWFHDAVYEGVPGADERASAELAAAELSRIGLSNDLVNEVCRLVLLTIDHRPAEGDDDGRLFVDADLSILGQVPGRYQMYVHGVRAEHPELSDREFRLARRAWVEALLSEPKLFGSQPGRRLWSESARRNLTAEAFRWTALLRPEDGPEQN